MIQIFNLDCFDFLKTVKDKSIDCILTDPPYFKIVKDKWDNQWNNIAEYQQFVEKLAIEFKEF